MVVPFAQRWEESTQKAFKYSMCQAEGCGVKGTLCAKHNALIYRSHGIHIGTFCMQLLLISGQNTNVPKIHL